MCPLITVRGLPEIPVVYFVCHDLEVRTTQVDLLFEIRNIIARIRESIDLAPPNKDPLIPRYRLFTEKHGYRSMIRVYPEVLIEVISNTRRLPRYNSVLDLVNALSTLTRIPISPIDADKVRPPLKLSYLVKDTVVKDFRGKDMRVPKGAVILGDSINRVVYVYPYKITDVAPITVATKNAFFIGYGAPGVPLNMVISSIKMLITYINNFMRNAQCSQIEVDVGREHG